MATGVVTGVTGTGSAAELFESPPTAVVSTRRRVHWPRRAAGRPPGVVGWIEEDDVAQQDRLSGRTNVEPNAADESVEPGAELEASATEEVVDRTGGPAHPQGPEETDGPQNTPQPDSEQSDPPPGDTDDSQTTGGAAETPATPRVTHVPRATTDPARWGWIDADGTVYVRSAQGDRAVGSWQAGPPEEGLAHFARRFDDLLTEVELLANRIASGTSDPKQALQSARHLRDGLPEAAVVGDVDRLAQRVDELVAQAEEAVAAARAAREAQRAAAIARKEALVAEAEEIAASSTQWKWAGDRLKAILEEWRTIRGVDRKTDEQLWKRYARARDAFNRRRGSHFAELDRQRAAARARKEELVAEAEALADSEDWSGTATRYRELMAEWRAAGRAPKEADDALWQRFRAAQDTFFTRRKAALAQREAEWAANAEAKRALLAEAEKIDLSDPDAARAALRSIQERWDQIGRVPRDEVKTLESRLRAVEERVRAAAERKWRRTDAEAEARIAQFRERVAQYEAQARKARAAGDERRAQEAEQLAAQWREWLATAERAVQRR